jgi:predicted acylesterase/phospholipase RssA
MRLWLEALRVIVPLSPSVGHSLLAIFHFPSFDRGGVDAKTIVFHRNWRAIKYAMRWLLGFLAILIAPSPLVLYWLWRKVNNRQPPPDNSMLDRFLEYFCLKKELGDSYTLEQAFVRFFDRDYYGRSSMDRALVTGLSHDRNRPQVPSPGPEEHKKRLSIFAQHAEEKGEFPIHVVPVAANLKDCELGNLPDDTPVVDALLAATALVPFFKAREVKGEFYIDGANVSSEPIRQAMRFLQTNVGRIADDILEIIVYSVAPFPIKGAVKAPHAGGRAKIYSRVVDIALRASALAQLRDAQLDQELMRLYNKVLPQDKPIWWHDNIPYFRAEPVPIATQSRSTLTNASLPPVRRRNTISCSIVIRSLREANKARLPQRKMDDDQEPGVSEICRACRGKRSKGTPGVQLQVPKSWTGDVTTVHPCACPPHQTDSDKASPQTALPGESLQNSSAATDGSGKAQVALLFSGGVFRGVFQIGVANALALVLNKPHIVAGASVGSVTASLVAQLFCEKSDNDRKVQIGRLAATYLTLDRLVLTIRCWSRNPWSRTALTPSP